MKKIGPLIICMLAVGLVSVALAAGPRNTGFQIQNLGTEPAKVTIYFYNTDGSLQCVEGPHSIPVGGSKSFFKGWETSPIADCIGKYTGLVSWLGSAVIETDQPLAVIANIREETEYAAGAYDGTPDTQVGQPLILPGLFGSNTYGFTSDFAIQNAGAMSTTVDIVFCGSVDGAPPSDCTEKVITGQVIEKGASFYYDMEVDTDLPANWIGVAIVTPRNGTPLAGTVNQRPAGGAAGALFTFDAVAADKIPADAKSSLPGLMKDYYNYWTGVQVIATEDDTTGNIKIYAPGGVLMHTEPFDLDQWESQALFVSQLENLSDNVLYYGTVEFTSGKGAAIGSQRDFPGTSGLGYSGIFAEGTTANLNLPFVARNFWGVSTGFAIKNDGADGRIDIYFKGTPGTGSADFEILGYALGAGESLNLFQWPPGCAADPVCAAIHPNITGCTAESCGNYPASYTEKWTGSVRVEGSAGMALSSIVNERGYEVPADGDLGLVYNAFNN